MFQPPNHLGSPSWNFSPVVQYIFVLQSPKLDTEFKIWSHTHWIVSSNPITQSAVFLLMQSHMWFILTLHGCTTSWCSTWGPPGIWVLYCKTTFYSVHCPTCLVAALFYTRCKTSNFLSLNFMVFLPTSQSVEVPLNSLPSGYWLPFMAKYFAAFTEITNQYLQLKPTQMGCTILFFI